MNGYDREMAAAIIRLHELHRYMVGAAGAGSFLDFYSWLGMHGSAKGSPSATLVGRGDSYPRIITDDMLGFIPEHGYCRFDVAEGAAKFAFRQAERAVMEAKKNGLSQQPPPKDKIPVGVGMAQALTSFSAHDENWKGGYIVLMINDEEYRIEVQFVSGQTEAELEKMARGRRPDQVGEPDGLMVRRFGQNQALNEIALSLLLRVTGCACLPWPSECDGNCQIVYNQGRGIGEHYGLPYYSGDNLPALKSGSDGWAIPNSENLVAAVPVPFDVTIIGSDGKAINATVEGGYYHVASMIDDGEVNVYASDEHRMNPNGLGGAYVEAGQPAEDDPRASVIYDFWDDLSQPLEPGSVKLWRKVRPAEVIGEFEGTGILLSDEGEYPFEPGDYLFHSADRNRYWVVRRAVFGAGYLPDLLAEKPEVSVID